MAEGFCVIWPVAGSRPTAPGRIPSDISRHRAKHRSELTGRGFDYVIMSGTGRETFAATCLLRWSFKLSFEDPAAVTGTEEARLILFGR
jgi:hypothetical protein